MENKENKIKLDMRVLALVTLGKKLEAKLLSKETKDKIRNNDYTITYGEYGNIIKTTKNISHYTPEDQAKIDTFIKEQGIEKITETKEAYTITIVPSQKAENTFNKMLEDAQKTTTNERKRIASAVSKAVASKLKK